MKDSNEYDDSSGQMLAPRETFGAYYIIFTKECYTRTAQDLFQNLCEGLDHVHILRRLVTGILLIITVVLRSRM